MNHNKYAILLSLLTALLLALPASAYDFMLDGLCYNKNSGGKSVQVTYHNSSSPSYSWLSGALTIPSSVTYSGKTYSVTSIGREAFYGCSRLTSVTIPNSVTFIGESAFDGCSRLTSVTIPNSVTSIGDEAFYGCSSLTSVTIPNSVTSIGNKAFYICSGLTSVTIPNSVTKIGDYAFYDCSGLTSVTIPNSVTSIGSYAFRDCSGLTSVTIGNSVTSIGNDAFSGCSNIEELNIDNNACAKISVFSAAKTALKKLVLGNSVISIGYQAFSGCSDLTSVTIGNSVTSIGSEAFRYCSGLTSVTWDAKSCNDISSSSSAPFNGLTNIKTFEFGNDVEKIPAYLCYGLSGLTSVTWNAKSCNDFSSSGNAPFNGLTNIKTFEFGNEVEKIPAYLCYGLSRLTTVTIPNSVTSIGDWAFRGCSGITSILVRPGNTSYDSRDNCNAIIETSTNTLIVGCNNSIIPNSVTSIGEGAFYACSGLTSVTIPNSVTSIGESAFYGCSKIEELYIDNNAFAKISVFTAAKIALKKLVLGNSVTSIGESAFSGCSGLTSVTIPNSVTSIGNYAFSRCSGLTSVTIPNSVTSISNSTFYDCSGLTSVTIPNSVTSIGDCAFEFCSRLTSVTIPNSVSSIGDKAFYDCSGLTSVTIPNSVTSIGSEAFRYCSGLTSVTWNAKSCNDISSSSSAPFNGSTNIKTFEFGNEVEKIPAYLCYYRSGLTSVTIPNSVTSIGNYAFCGCSGLTSVTIPNSVTSIGYYAFSYCSGVTSILVSPGNTSYDSRENCNAIIETSTNKLIVGCNNSIIPNSVTSIGNGAFYGCSGLTSVTIPNSVTSIDNWAFSRCSGLTSVTIPNSVTSIGSYAFQYCSGLRSIYSYLDPAKVTLGSSVFYNVDKQQCVLYCPKRFVDAYRNADQWRDFTNISTFIDKYVTSISFVKTATNIYYKGVEQLTVTVLPGDADEKAVNWSSSDPEVASVDQNGNVQANKLGTATVTAAATDGSGVSASCEVTVTGMQSITMKNKTQLYVQGSEKLIATIEPNDLIVNELNWTTSDANVVSVDRYGNIRGLKPGSATVTATATDGSGVSATCRVTVTGIETITLNKTSVSIYAQETEKLVATITPSDVIVKDLRWSSSRSSVVSVDQYGNIRGLSVGTATVTATATDGSGVSASCDVTVAGTSDFVLSDSELLMFVADSYRLGATFTPSDIVWKTLNWTSSDTNVATVSSDGIITARGSGTATITATTTDGTYLSRSCQVTVVPKYNLSAGVLEHLRGDDEAVVALPIMLDNKTGVAQLQFDFTLPEGVTIVGEYNASTGVTYYDDCIHLDNDRKTRSHYATINHLEGSTYRALISTSQSNLALKGNHGTVANLMLHLAQYHEAGDYSILFSNIVMSGTDVNDQHTAVNYNSLVRFHYVLGDANADVDVDVADYQATARVILNLSTPRFYADAANVYNDYSINVSDLQGIVNIMAGIDPAVIKHAPKEPLPTTALALVPRMLGDGRIAIALTGDVPIGALQMDLTLPHGVTLEQAVMASRNATHRVDYAALDDGTVRLIVGSPARATLEPDDEAFLVLTLAGASGGTATLGDALAVETDLTTHRLADVAFDITPTGVNDPTADSPRIYVENNLLVIESPTGGDAQLVHVNGIASPLSVTAGRNEYTLDQGVYIVRMGNTTAKIMIKP